MAVEFQLESRQFQTVYKVIDMDSGKFMDIKILKRSKRILK